MTFITEDYSLIKFLWSGSFFCSCQKVESNGTNILRSFASSINDLHRVFWSKVELLPNKNKEHLARVMATFNLLASFKKPIPPEAKKEFSIKRLPNFNIIHVSYLSLPYAHRKKLLFPFPALDIRQQC